MNLSFHADNIDSLIDVLQKVKADHGNVCFKRDIGNSKVEDAYLEGSLTTVRVNDHYAYKALTIKTVYSSNY